MLSAQVNSLHWSFVCVLYTTAVILYGKADTAPRRSSAPRSSLLAIQISLINTRSISMCLTHCRPRAELVYCASVAYLYKEWMTTATKQHTPFATFALLLRICRPSDKLKKSSHIFYVHVRIRNELSDVPFRAIFCSRKSHFWSATHGFWKTKLLSHVQFQD